MRREKLQTKTIGGGGWNNLYKSSVFNDKIESSQGDSIKRYNI